MRTTIIAEIGINHGGSIRMAHVMVDDAVRAGADIVKFQTVDPDLVYKKSDPLYNIFDRTQLTKDEWVELKTHVESLGREFLSTPGEKKSADLLDSIGVKHFKIASDSAKDVDFVNYVMAKGKPVCVSMGKLHSLYDIHSLIYKYKKNPDVIFHCVSNYPTLPKDANFKLLKELIGTGIKIGYSDHVQGIESAIAAVALGAQVIEKHIMLNDSNIDAAVSLSSKDFKKMVDAIRRVEEML